VIHSQTIVTRRAPSAGKSGTFAGLASTWSVDRHGERIARGAFARSIQALSAGAVRIPLLFEHSPLEQLGAITKATETDEGLEIEAVVVLGTPIADRVHDLARNNAVGFSVGFTPFDGGRGVDGDGRIVYTAVDLLEVSVVSVPSNRESVVHTVRSLATTSPADFERMLRDGALPPMPRRLAAKIARVALPLIGAEPDEPEHSSADLAALGAALDGFTKTFKR
jgi:HK97 family phage prohead protease